MIAVEIPAALADDPQVVPVGMFIGPDGLPIEVPVRVALAWRETCPTCEGTGHRCACCRRRSSLNPLSMDAKARCLDCDGTGSRMVVGWTAEVEAVVPIVNRDTPAGATARGPRVIVVSHYLGRGGGVWVHGLGDRSWSLPSGTIDAADWSPGRYALVLRNVSRQGILVATDLHDGPVPCRPFSGFAELSGVLA